ncbi:MAG: hypothetical protein L0Z49_01565 [Actinobacteria bacterium]|nr:hypothetical protein [Actinomycetota bacterium]MCI0543115.1 hypothetical protein [Actinomycetota bacterium]MCI0678998.1 hypothetical protein [Actinomycetota bacterium]
MAAEGTGCREAFFATAMLVGLGLVFMIGGLTMVRQTGCDGVCETAGLTLLYAGGPVSATFGLFFDGLVLAWPLDITLWVAIGVLVARRTERVWGPVMVIVLLSLAYGLVLSQLVELAV